MVTQNNDVRNAIGGYFDDNNFLDRTFKIYLNKGYIVILAYITIGVVRVIVQVCLQYAATIKSEEVHS